MCDKKDCFYNGYAQKCIRCSHYNPHSSYDFFIVEPYKRTLLEDIEDAMVIRQKITPI